MPQFDDHMLSLFWPAVEASGRVDLWGQLRTVDLPPERRGQFSKLKRLKPRDGPILLPRTSALARFFEDDRHFVALSIEGLSFAEREEFFGWATGEGFLITEPDEATAMFMSYYFPTLFRLKEEYIAAGKIEPWIDIVGSGYLGHDILDVVRWHGEISILEIPADWSGSDRSIEWVGAKFEASLSSFRWAAVTPAVADRMNAILELENVSGYNAFLALSSTQARQVFFESYKFLESIFYLPWAQSLRDSLALNLSAFEVARQCRKELAWRRSEKESIVNLFEMAPNNLVRSASDRRISCFLDLQPGKVTRGAYGRRIYKIRNIIVHQEDYDDQEELVVGDADWSPLTEYLLDIVLYLYRSWRNDIPLSKAA